MESSMSDISMSLPAAAIATIGRRAKRAALVLRAPAPAVEEELCGLVAPRSAEDEAAASYGGSIAGMMVLGTVMLTIAAILEGVI
jgi:hypothetical protein